MKILDPECGPERWKTIIYCTGRGNGGGGCGTCLEIREEDIYNTFSYDYLGDRDTYYTVCCPVCGKETDIDSRLVNFNVSGNSKQKVLTRYKKQKLG